MGKKKKGKEIKLRSLIFFFGPHPWHVGAPGSGIHLETQLLWQCWILNSSLWAGESHPHHSSNLSHCRDIRSLTCCATAGTPMVFAFEVSSPVKYLNGLRTLLRTFEVTTIFLFVWLVFLGLHLQHTEVPRLGVKSELQLLASTTATATRDPSHICDPHHSSRQQQIPNPLSEARDQTYNLMIPSRICFCCSMMGTPGIVLIQPDKPLS